MDARKYKFAVIAADVVIFTVAEDELKVLLIKMKKKPFNGTWASPGGLVKSNEPVDVAAKRHLAEKTGVKNVYLEQLYTFGKIDRDPFGRVVSVAYMALIPMDNIKLKTTEEYEDIKWFDVKKLPHLAYDHKEIIDYAISRLRAKLGYTNIAHALLPKKFTLGELQKVYETILARKLDKRNFRKKIVKLSMLKRLREKKLGIPNRPAELFRFSNRYPQIIEIL